MSLSFRFGASFLLPGRRWLAGFSLAAGLCGSAWAQAAPDACPAKPAYPLPAGIDALKVLAATLEQVSAEPSCLSDPYFHAYRGAVLMSLGQASAATEPLERALLMQPDLPGAQLDLAQAMAQLGDTSSASGLLRELQQRTDLPGPLKQAVDRQLSLLAAAPLTGERWFHRWQVSSQAGRDSNLNNAPSVSELTLTSALGDLTLPLAPGSQARRGSSLLSNVQWQGLRPAAASLWVLQAELRDRHTRSRDTNYQQGDISATWLQASEAPRQWIARAGLSNLHFGGRNLYQSHRASLQYLGTKLGAIGDPAGTLGRLTGNCRPAVSLELENRRYPQSRELAGLYHGGAVALQCSDGNGAAAVAGTSANYYSVLARVGRDSPDSDDRPGGVYDRQELRAQWDGAMPGWMGSGRLGVQWSLTHQKDSAGYSSLLANNAIRRINRHALQLEGSWPLGQGFSLLVTTELGLQRSNLAAFSTRQHSLHAGLRWESF